jgi:hypothetical protein
MSGEAQQPRAGGCIMANVRNIFDALLKGRRPLLEGVDSRGRKASLFVHPSSPLNGDKLALVQVFEANGTLAAESVTFELDADEAHQLVGVLSILLVLLSNS